MTTIKNLTGTVGTPTPVEAPKFNNKPAAKGQPTMHNMQSRKGFWRNIKHFKDHLEFSSSTGGLVSIPISTLWATAEAADAKLKAPTPPPAP